MKKNLNPALYIGVLSGTSMDAIDVALLDFSKEIKLVASYNHPFPPELKTKLWKVIEKDDRFALEIPALDEELGLLFAEAINTLLAQHGYNASQIIGIGSHGQNIGHHPNDPEPYSLQIGNPQLIANLTGIPTVGHFRSADIAAGGQGAPLAPLLHQKLFHHPEKNRAIVNIGGIANITTIPSSLSPVTGFDTGPGNGLLDAWIKQEKNLEYDADGTWAKSGDIDENFLAQLLDDPYFSQQGPKSTGKEYFNLKWLADYLNGQHPQNVQRTLVELTAQTIINAIHRLNWDSSEIIICGGGAHNKFLLERLAQLTKHPVLTTNDLGINTDFVEAMLFAWLGKMRLDETKLDTTEITGAKYPVLLGEIFYPK